MRSLLRSVTPQPIRTLVRRTIEAVGHIRHGYLVPKRDFSRLIGMTSTDERRFYEECVATVANIDGEIVDLGCWMCSTTISLAKGVRACAESVDAPATKVYAFDRFIWEDWMNPYMASLSCRYRRGESFLPEARGMLGDMRDDVNVIVADLTDYRWNGRAIKILLVDAMKSAQLAQRISEGFYPYLAPGALLIHQDFKHYYTPWIHILQYRLRDYFRFYYETPTGGTVAFETLKEIPHDVAASAVRIADISEDEVDAAFQYSMDLVGSTGKSAVAAAHVMHFVHRSEAHAARNTVERYAKLAHPKEGNFSLAKECLRALA